MVTVVKRRADICPECHGYGSDPEVGTCNRCNPRCKDCKRRYSALSNPMWCPWCLPVIPFERDDVVRYSDNHVLLADADPDKRGRVVGCHVSGSGAFAHVRWDDNVGPIKADQVLAKNLECDERPIPNAWTKLDDDPFS